jgi:hypothetical protein
MIHYMLVEKYPAPLISIEKEMKLGELSKRCDIVVYDRNAVPFMIIECKEMNVSVSRKTLEQIMRYHITIPAEYLIVTNGSYCFGFQKIDNQFVEINEFPEYPLK